MCSGEEPTGCWTDLWYGVPPAKRRVVGKERERAGSSHKSVKDPFCLSEVWPAHGQGEKKKEGGGIRGALALRIEF